MARQSKIARRHSKRWGENLADTTGGVMGKHYDKATKNEQMERREDYLVDV